MAKNRIIEVALKPRRGRIEFLRERTARDYRRYSMMSIVRLMRVLPSPGRMAGADIYYDIRPELMIAEAD